ncbi:MAG: hypothetical protein ACRDK1_06030 [Solirubrobacterales bacterium]
MRTRLAMIALVGALFATCAAAGLGPGTAQAKVVKPHQRPISKEPAVIDLRHFRNKLRGIDHASHREYRRLLAKKRHVTSDARDALDERDKERQHALKAYLHKPGRHHRGRTKRRSEDYYAYLRSLESHTVRQLVASISDEIDRLAYS